MISLLDINLAINYTIEKAVRDILGYCVPIVAEDLKEPICRPSIKVTFGDSKSGKFNNKNKERTLTCRVYFFAKERERNKFDNIKMQEVIENAFLEDIEVNQNFYIPITEVESVVTDGVLICSFDLYIIERLTDTDTSEIMESLNVSY